MVGTLLKTENLNLVYALSVVIPYVLHFTITLLKMDKLGIHM